MSPDQSARIARRHPWSQYQGAHRKTCGDAAWAGTWPFCVDWVVGDSSPGLYGWRSEVRMFKTRDEAMAAASAPMGVARSVSVRTITGESLYSRLNPNIRKA